MDETNDNNHIEQVSFVFLYAFDGDVHESFLLFNNVETTDTANLFDSLKKTMDSLGLSSSQIRGQCYNGATNMSGRYNWKSGSRQSIQKLSIFIWLNIVLI